MQSLAIYTKWEGWVLDDVEADSIARPAARIIARHAWLAESVRTVADPIALIVAVVAVMLPRIMGYRLAYAQFVKQQEQAKRDGTQAQPPPANGPTSASADPNAQRDGATAVNFAERLIRDNGV